MNTRASSRWLFGATVVLSLMTLASSGQEVAPRSAADSGAVVPNGTLPTPLPLFPANNWWNVDISSAPVDPNSAAFIAFIKQPNPSRGLRPDFGGIDVDNGAPYIYGIPYVVVDGTQPKVAVQFDYSDESDGVNHNTDTSFPFYPIPEEAKTQPYFIEGGPPGNQDVGGDRHLLIVDRDNKFLYELWDTRFNGTNWTAGSGAFFDMKTNNRRPEGWTSADAAGLAVLPGLVRYDEVSGPNEIDHAFRVTLRAANGHVFPASHTAGTVAGALPMGARLRLKSTKDISGFTPAVQKIFRAMKKHGLIMADNGSDLYVSGAFNTQWDNGVLNPAFAAIKADDLEVIKLGYVEPPAISINNATVSEGNSGNSILSFTVNLSAATFGTVTVNFATSNGTASSGVDYTATSGTFSIPAGSISKNLLVVVKGDAAVETDETLTMTLNSPLGATLAQGTATGTIVNDDPATTATTVTQYRLYHDGTKEHLYTTDLNEYNVLGAGGWIKEGVAYKMLTNGVYNGVATVPLFRLYHPGILQHHWTTDSNETTTLAATPSWFYEGTIGYLLPTQAAGSVPLYRMALANPALHLWTTDLNEYNTLATRNWIKEGVIGYVIP